MAIMIPSSIDASRAGGVSEGMVFEALSRLSDEWFVYANYLFCDPATDRDGEIDFLVVHRTLGLMAIECKGKGVWYDRAAGRWYREYRGEVKETGCPFVQVKDHKYRLRGLLTEKMREHFDLMGGEFPWIFGHMVVMPQARWVAGALPNHISRPLFMDAGDLDDVEGGLGRAFAYFREAATERYPENPRRPPHQHFRAITDRELGLFRKQVLHPSFSLVPNLSVTLRRGNEAFVRLSEQQRHFMAGFLGNRRLLIKGGAGTGKTLLALEAARILAERGGTVLLLCFNKALGKYLAARVRELFGEKPPIRADHFHGFVGHIVTAGGGSLDDLRAEAGDEKTFWNETAPLALVDAAERPDFVRYDHIVIDEGQDFRAAWWVVLEDCMRDRAEGRLVIFADPLQNIFDHDLELPGDLFGYDLTVNFRNAVHIAQEVKKLAHGEMVSDARCPQGLVPRFHRQGSTAKTLKELTGIVARLLGGEQLMPDQIALLTPHSNLHSSLAGLTELAGVPVSRDPMDRAGALLHSTIGRFKGLESDVVILLDVDPADPLCTRNMLYVAISRARLVLHIFHKGDWPTFGDEPGQ
ncbi:NERD domain-containing protein [Myxococcota bacterium]|nr:NERD domain-containing protein [Myxococcota bacterium]MBU1537441.1 NERD domain-containing protein [Myxococcota bacterium]